MSRLIDISKYEVLSFQNKSQDFVDGVQWILEQMDKEPTVKTIPPCEDCISRAEAIENIKHAQFNFSVKSEIDFTKYKREVQEIANGILNAQIKALSEMPSVKPKPDVLDKIRAEMDDLASHKIHPISFDQSVAVDMCINIIDKYRREG